MRRHRFELAFRQNAAEAERVYGASFIAHGVHNRDREMLSISCLGRISQDPAPIAAWVAASSPQPPRSGPETSREASFLRPACP